MAMPDCAEGVTGWNVAWHVQDNRITVEAGFTSRERAIEFADAIAAAFRGETPGREDAPEGLDPRSTTSAHVDFSDDGVHRPFGFGFVVTAEE
jgi:hypothetical protein